MRRLIRSLVAAWRRRRSPLPAVRRELIGALERWLDQEDATPETVKASASKIPARTVGETSSSSGEASSERQRVLEPPGMVRTADALTSPDPIEWLAALAWLGRDVSVLELEQRLRSVFSADQVRELAARSPRAGEDRVRAADFCASILERSAVLRAALVNPRHLGSGGGAN